MFRTGALYVLASWLTLQVADVLFPGFGIPETAIQALVLAAVLGFPMALAFGWLYEIGPQGIRRTTDEAIEDAQVLDLGGRLAQRLLDEAGDGAVVTLTQTELARRIGASREKVNRKLHEWVEEGWISMGRAGIKLTARDRLTALIKDARAG